MNVSAWSIRNPIPAILLFVMLTLAGLVAFKAMKIQQFMDVDLPMVTVAAALPGEKVSRLFSMVMVCPSMPWGRVTVSVRLSPGQGCQVGYQRVPVL